LIRLQNRYAILDDQDKLNTIQNIQKADIEGNINIRDFCTIEKYRGRDIPIMEKAICCSLDTTKLKAVKNCRTYLQIMTMAEMVNIDGTHIL
jgi:hypothetical protein